MFKVFVNDETVPVDEYAAITQRLNENHIDYVERKRLIGSLYRFGSTGAGCDVLVENKDDAAKARQIIETYQNEIIAASRAEYSMNRAHNVKRERLGWAAAIIVIGLVLALSLGIGFW